jgi:hypothetical protein
MVLPALARWSAEGSHGQTPSRFVVVLIPHVLTIALLILAWVACVHFAVRSPKFSAVGKALWIALLFVGNLLAVPAFFWLYMWRRSSTAGGA